MFSDPMVAQGTFLRVGENEETYRRHLDVKRHEPRATRRRVVWEWVKRPSRWLDHLLDCEITQIAWAAFHG